MLPSFLGICHVGGGGGCPAYGTVLFNQNETYPINEGGSYVTVYSTDFANQTCDVDYIADGTCGQLVNWASVSNVNYVTNGTALGVASVQLDGNQYSLNTSIVETSELWYIGVPTVTFYKKYFSTANVISNGSGGYSINYADPVYWPYDFFLTTIENQTIINGNSYLNGTANEYRVDTNGSDYYLVGIGSYYSNGTLIFEDITGESDSVEVPSGSTIFYNCKYDGTRYYWDGSGGYTTDSNPWYKPNGTFIYNDGTYDYYWDGSGGYYS